LRRRLAVCGKCGAVFHMLYEGHAACDPCVRTAMELEGFAYPEGEPLCETIQSTE